MHQTIKNDIREFILSIDTFNENNLEAKTTTVSIIEQIVNQSLPGYSVHIFGSFATDLSLPSGDVDMVLVKTQQWMTNAIDPLHTLHSVLVSHEEIEQVVYLGGASFPVLKI